MNRLTHFLFKQIPLLHFLKRTMLKMEDRERKQEIYWMLRGQVFPASVFGAF